MRIFVVEVGLGANPKGRYRTCPYNIKHRYFYPAMV